LLIQKFYLQVSRRIRLLDLEAKSPLYQQFTETIEGIATIRAFGSQDSFEKEFLTRLDESQKLFYLTLCIQQWLGLILDSMVGCLVFALITIALRFPNTSSAGNLGVALTTVLSFNTFLQRLIDCWTQAESALGSVARTQSYEETTPNEYVEDHATKLEETWPNGTIEVSGLSVKYSNDDSFALRDINFSVKKAQKIGICGRTGW
jgi:ATP-binding cassette, subfamily C (CFTR/MRP), member 1